MARVVIIGAGLTGLSVAYHLEQQNCFDYLIFEQESTIGGLCRSIRTDGFTFDYTGHFFHSPSIAMIEFFKEVMKDSPVTSYARRSDIYSQSRYTPYPYQTNLYGLPTETIIDCITGFVQRSPQKNTRTFIDWVITHFGTGFARHFFFPYQEKIFDFPITKLQTGWVQAVPRTTLEEILKGALEERSMHSIGYNAQFWYPQAGGIDHLINAFGNALHNPIYTHCSAININTTNKTITLSNGHIEPYEHLVWTGPLNTCLNILGMNTQAKKLLCNSVININLGINKSELLLKHWVYYPERQYPFFRIGFPHTLQGMAPLGCSSLSVEVATMAQPTTELVGKLTQQALEQVKKLFKIRKRDILTEQVLVLHNAYVIYDKWREKHIQDLLAGLAIKSIYSIGRYGAWKYASMQDAIDDGKLMATQLISQWPHTYTPAHVIRSNPAVPIANRPTPQIKEI